MAVNKPTWQLFTPAWHRTALERRSIVFIGSSMPAATAGLVPFWRLASHQRPRLAFQKVSPLYQRNLLGGRFISEDPLHGGVRRS